MTRTRRARGRRRIRWSRVFFLLLFLFVAAALTGATVFYAYFGKLPAVAPGNPSAAALSGAEPVDRRVNILLLGVDDGDPDARNDETRRSDTMIVVSYQPEDGSVNLLSIPRDTRVSIPGRKGEDKITHAFAYGGVALARRTVEDFLNIPVHYHVILDWKGFTEVIDILGGVSLYVERPMNYEDPYAGLKIHLARGYQHLDGVRAGYYVRFRHDELGDIGRVQRQQRFVHALMDEMMQLGTLLKLPSLVSSISRHVETDMTLFTMAKLANAVKSLPADSLQTEMLPGAFATVDGLSYWVPDRQQTREIVERLFQPRRGKTTSVSESPAFGTF